MNYPSEAELNYIKNFNILEQDPTELVDFLESIWSYAEQGYFSRWGKKKIYLQLHTAGWSGNEDIIQALKNTNHLVGLFLYHTKWERGGHYWFKIPVNNKEAEQ